VRGMGTRGRDRDVVTERGEKEGGRIWGELEGRGWGVKREREEARTEKDLPKRSCQSLVHIGPTGEGGPDISRSKTIDMVIGRSAMFKA